MSKFDEIIGYTAQKKELRQIADVLKHREAYDRLGVPAPKGLLLHGEPGVGKSLMASAVIEESGRKAFTCRKDQPNGDFVKVIKKTFEEAVENAPAIVFLDDMDKFANSDARHPDTEEYVTVQSCIDEAKGKDIFVLATANNIHRLPDSLCRPGRFDRVLEIEAPEGEDALQIVTHYLQKKKTVGDIDVKTLARILDGKSCAVLETVINEAGLYAGYERADFITMDHLMEACLRMVFNVPASESDFEDEDFCDLRDAGSVKAHIVYHEAGHAVVSEILCPESVNLIYVHSRGGERGGFTSYYNDDSYTTLYWARSRIAASLGGLAAVEEKFGIPDIGGTRDLSQAFRMTYQLVEDNCVCGFHLFDRGENSDALKSQQESVAAGEVERFFRKAKEIIALNHDFFEKLAAALAEKKLLSAVDIQRIKSECVITPMSL